MNPVDLVTPQLIKYCTPMRTIVVCGFTKTGKISIAKELASKLKRKLIISDSYKFENYEDFKNDVFQIYNRKTPVVIEGVLCFGLLRKGIQEKNFNPDLIIKTICNESTIKYFYEKEKETDKIPTVLKFNKGLNTVWEEYISLLTADPSIKKPNYLELNTSLPYLK